jgi:hypothetical protein
MASESSLSLASTYVVEQSSQRSVLDVESDFERRVSDAPEGGTRAWLVAGGSAAIFFCTLGFANSFGTFEEYYLVHQLKRESASEIAWIGSLSSFLQFFTGIFGGPLFDRFGEKVHFYNYSLSCYIQDLLWEC